MCEYTGWFRRSRIWVDGDYGCFCLPVSAWPCESQAEWAEQQGIVNGASKESSTQPRSETSWIALYDEVKVWHDGWIEHMRIKIYILGHSISLHTGTATSIKTVAVGQTVMRSRQSFPHITGRDFTAMVKIVGSRLRELRGGIMKPFAHIF